MDLQRLSWTAQAPKNHKHFCFFKVFADAAFRYVGALDRFLGLILALLGHSGPKMGPQNGFKSYPKNVQALVQKMTPKMTPT